MMPLGLGIHLAGTRKQYKLKFSESVSEASAPRRPSDRQYEVEKNCKSINL